jgi:hypothetical protein
MDSSNRGNVLDYYQDILLAIFIFMLQDRGRLRDVKRLTVQQLAQAQLIVRSEDRRRESTSGILGAVLHEWHRNASYLDNSIVPKAIRLYGPKPSVAALVRSQDLKADSAAVVREMVQLGLVRRAARGKYLPVGRVATIRRLSPALVDHVARSLERLLATVNFNTRLNGEGNTLIERTAFVHDLPQEHLRDFRMFAQQQGSAFLANADEWLESRRAPKTRSRRTRCVRAGIHVYAFEEPLSRRTTVGPPRRATRRHPSASA